MARMPQIPEPQISNRPQMGVGKANVDIGAELEPMQGAAAGAGAALDDLVKQKEKAADQLLKMHNDSMASALAGQHDVALSNLGEQIKNEYVDHPEQWAEQARIQSLNIKEATTKDPNKITNQDVAMEFSKQADQSNRKFLDHMQALSVGRMAQQIKGNQFEDEKNAITKVAASPTPEQYLANLREAQNKLSSGWKNVAGGENAKIAATKFQEKSAQEWVSRNADPLKNPLAVWDTLQDDKHPITKSLSGIEGAVEKGRKDALKAFEGAAEIQQVGMLERSHRAVSDIMSLASTHDPGFLSMTSALRDEADSYERGLPQRVPVGQGESAETVRRMGKNLMDMRGIIDNAESIYRQGLGTSSSKGLDPATFEKLRMHGEALFGKNAKSYSGFLNETLDFRAQATQAFKDQKISRAEFDSLEKPSAAKLSQIVKEKSADASNSWFASGEKAGHQQVNDLLDKNGIFKNADAMDRNNVWVTYLLAEQKATADGKVLSKAAARQLAEDVVKHVMSFKGK